MITVSFLRETAESFAKNLGAFQDIDKSVRIDVIKHRPQFDHIRAVERDIKHVALCALVPDFVVGTPKLELDAQQRCKQSLFRGGEHGLFGLFSV